MDDAIKATDFDNLDLLPADFTYRNLDLVLDAAKKPARRIASLLAPLSAEYDVVFLDCPPGISLLSESVLHAADTLLVPLIPTTLSVRTLDQLTEFISDFDGRKPAVLAFFSMIDRRKRLHREIAEQLPAQRSDVADDRDPGPVADRADVGAARPGDRVRAAQRRRAELRGAVAGGAQAERAARSARRRLVIRPAGGCRPAERQLVDAVDPLHAAQRGPRPPGPAPASAARGTPAPPRARRGPGWSPGRSAGPRRR